MQSFLPLLQQASLLIENCEAVYANIWTIFYHHNYSHQVSTSQWIQAKPNHNPEDFVYCQTFRQVKLLASNSIPFGSYYTSYEILREFSIGFAKK
jgi:hypothetical protein